MIWWCRCPGHSQTAKNIPYSALRTQKASAKLMLLSALRNRIPNSSMTGDVAPILRFVWLCTNYQLEIGNSMKIDVEIQIGHRLKWVNRGNSLLYPSISFADYKPEQMWFTSLLSGYPACYGLTLYVLNLDRLDKNVPILHGQYHGCWCPGNARSQGINNHDIDLVKPR